MIPSFSAIYTATITTENVGPAEFQETQGGNKCMWYNTNVNLQNLKSVSNTVSWILCAKKCDAEPECHASSFVTEDYADVSQHGKCRLKSKLYFQHKESLKGL